MLCRRSFATISHIAHARNFVILQNTVFFTIMVNFTFMLREVNLMFCATSFCYREI